MESETRPPEHKSRVQVRVQCIPTLPLELGVGEDQEIPEETDTD